MLKLRIVESSVWMRNVRFRMPFRFGSARMTAAPICHLRVVIEDASGRRGWGVAADLLPPAWFDKRPGRDLRRDLTDLLTSVDLARDAYLAHAQRLATPFDLWRETEASILAAGKQRDIPPLAAGCGAALYERAVLDAAARLLGQPAWRVILSNELGIDLGSLHPDLRRASTPQTVLPAQPLKRIWVRHTVGMADPLTDADLGAGEALNDGLPQTLEQVLNFYGVCYLKIKIGAGVEADLERLKRIASVVDKLPNYYATLDGNEQYRSWEDLARLVRLIQEAPALKRLAEAVLFVEQPLYRDQALAEEGAAARAQAAAWRPLLIDESDDTLEAWPRAAKLGYRGVSFKGCKGFYKALRNKALALAWQRAGQGDFILSSEDLTAPPLVPLQQYLALGAILGIEHQERNGHHYTHGLDWLSPTERKRALANHPDLYAAEGNFARVRVEKGQMKIGSLLKRLGLAVADEPDWAALIPQEKWTVESVGE